MIYYNIKTWNYYKLLFKTKKISKLKHFLTKHEEDIYHSFKFFKRKKDWLLGRLNSKLLIIEWSKKIYNYDLNFNQIEVLNNKDGVPYFKVLNLNNKKLNSIFHNINLSISHSNNIGFSGLSYYKIGVDIETITPKDISFIDTFFTKEEKNIIEKNKNDKDKISTIIWSLKESFLKAIEKGLKANTKKIKILFPSSTPRLDKNKWITISIKSEYIKNQDNLLLSQYKIRNSQIFSFVILKQI